MGKLVVAQIEQRHPLLARFKVILHALPSVKRTMSRRGHDI